MATPEYMYVSVIAASPETVWKGLTHPEFTRQYWHKTGVESSFRVGDPIRFMVDSGEVGCEGVILVAEPPHRLSYTWQFPRNPDTRDEAPSRVSFLLEEIAQGTRLTVIHDQFPEASNMVELIKPGWPLVICGLKTLLEAPAAVDFTAEQGE